MNTALQKKQTRLRVQRYRNSQKALQEPALQGSVTLTRPNRLGSNGLPEMVDNEYNPDELLEDGSKRFLGPLSDGQVLDRTTPKVDPDNVVGFYIKYGRY